MGPARVVVLAPVLDHHARLGQTGEPLDVEQLVAYAGVEALDERVLPRRAGEITTIERDLASFVLESAEARRLLTVPGVGMITDATFLAQIGTAPGDINRFTSPRRLVGYLGLDPRVRQPGNGPANTGRISKEGAAQVRHVLVDSALTAIRSPGPLRAFYQRIRAHRGHPIAIVATARKMAKLFWHLLVREQDYAYTLPTLLAKKIRTIELKAGGERRQRPARPDQPRAATRDRAPDRRTRPSSLRTHHHRLATSRRRKKHAGTDLIFIRPLANSFNAWSATISFNCRFSQHSV
jgi:hypothetical protein